jgi:hypothetical protein
MPYLGNVPSSFNVGTNNIDNDAITTEKIAAGAVVNADVNAAAAIAGTKISPDFGSQNILTTGTSTAASFSPSSSSAPTNGFYLPSANQVAISTNGQGRLFVDASGNVNVDNYTFFVDATNNRIGIGVGSPSKDLHLGSTSATLRLGNDNSAQYVDIYRDTADGLIKYDSAQASPFCGHVFLTSGTERMRLNSSGGFQFKGAGTAGVTQAVSFNGSAPINSLVIDSSGNVSSNTNTFFIDRANSRVGLGTSSASSLLHLSVATAASDGTKGVRISNPAGTTAIFECGSSNDSYIGTTSGSDFSIRTSNTARICVLNGGNVGIGSNAPNGLLALGFADAGSASLEFRTTSYSNLAQIVANNPSSDTGEITFRTRTGGSAFDRVKIDGSGRLLVGTSTTSSAGTWAQYAFIKTQGNTSAATGPGVINIARGEAATAITTDENIGAIAFTDQAGNEFAVISSAADADAGSGDYPGRLVFYTTPDGSSTLTERLRLTAAGLFQSMPIYNTTGGDAANVVVNSNGTVYRSTSSAKYKTDIETLQDEFADAVLGLRPVWYRSTCAIDNPDWSYWGFIAEEVAEIDSRLVSWKTSQVTFDDKGSAVQTPCEPEPEGVQYDRFVPHLLNLIKRQKEQIEAMEARLSALEAS